MIPRSGRKNFAKSPPRVYFCSEGGIFYGIGARHNRLQTDEGFAPIHRPRAGEVSKVISLTWTGYVRTSDPMSDAYSTCKSAKRNPCPLFVGLDSGVRYAGDGPGGMYGVEGLADNDSRASGVACRQYRPADNRMEAIFNKARTMTIKVFIGELLLLKWVRHASFADAL